MPNLFLTLDATRDFYLSADQDKTTAFKLGAIDSLAILYIGQEYRKNPDNLALAVLFLRFALKGVTGPDVPELTFETLDVPNVGPYRVASIDFLKRLPLEAIKELSAEVAKDNVLGEVETKN